MSNILSVCMVRNNLQTINHTGKKDGDGMGFWVDSDLLMPQVNWGF